MCRQSAGSLFSTVVSPDLKQISSSQHPPCISVNVINGHGDDSHCVLLQTEPVRCGIW